jgi:hypothetical protein
VLFAPPQTIAKTSSGKLMRGFVRERYEAGRSNGEHALKGSGHRNGPRHTWNGG